MGTLSDGLDYATTTMCEAAGVMIAASEMFAPCVEIGRVMPLGVGGPGSLAQAAGEWLAGAQALEQAQHTLTERTGGLSSESWSGADRDAFDANVRDLAAQLGDAHNLATAVGGVLAGLAVPLGAYGPLALSIGIVNLTNALLVEAATASIVGDLGASETLYAEGTAVAATCSVIVTAAVGVIAGLMTEAAEGLGSGELTDVAAQRRNGDTSAMSDFTQAQVKGLAEVGQNVESLVVGYAAGKLGDRATEGLPDGTVADKAVAHIASGKVSDLYTNANTAATDLVTGKDPLTALTDDLGITPQVTLAKDVADDAVELPANLEQLINDGVDWGKK
jgi:hypothetical protein